MRKALLLTVILALLALPAASQAKPLPDSAAVDQYTEAIPTAKGPRSEGGGGALPPGTAESLNSLGIPGVAAVAKETAPSPGDGGSQTSGLGIWLWLILAACLVAALTRFFARRRTSRPAA
jgi:hypothetical protein